MRIAILVAGVAALCTGCQSARPPIPADLAFLNVNVVDVAAATILPGQTVLVKGDRIVAIGTKLAIAETTRSVDGSGRYLIPGLMDMHTHISSPDQLYLYLATGVTTVRHMAGDSVSLRWRREVAEGKLLGPRIVTAGPLIDGRPRIWTFGVEVTDPAVIDTLVRHQKEAGYDFVKVYSQLTPEVFEALIAAGAKYGIEISGHVPQDVPLTRAIEAGMRTGEHFIGAMKAVWRDTALATPDLSALDQRARQLVVAIGAGQVAGSSLIDSAKVAALGALAARSDFWFDPTHDIMRNFTSNPVTGRPEGLRYMSAPERALLRDVHKGFGLTPDVLAGEDSLYPLRTRLLASLFEAGAKIIAGTDNAMLNGWALKDEIVALAKAGLGNAGALRAATLSAAEYLGKRGELGEVREGAVADLVLLGGNPLDDLEALYHPDGVMARGVWRLAAEFVPRLDSIAAAKAAQKTLDLGVGLEK
ncbi:MAG: amidohydrolase family protein [Gemmatimonadetes bacterium]|nr:amidohydrolase family protein [Gemmatimonadota bacterium]